MSYECRIPFVHGKGNDSIIEKGTIGLLLMVPLLLFIGYLLLQVFLIIISVCRFLFFPILHWLLYHVAFLIR